MDKNENETQYGRRDFLRLGATAAAGVAAASAGAGLVDVARAADPRAQTPAGSLSVAIWGGPPDIQSLKDAVNRYQKQYPQVHITLRYGANACGVSYADCKTLIAGGTMPDVFVPGIWNYNAMVDGGVLTDLGPYIARDKVSLSAFNPKVISQMRALKDGKIYGLPMGFNVQSLYYNKDMFDKAKLPYPSVSGNYTWQDLRAMAKTLTLDANGNTPASANFNPNKIKQWGFYTLAAVPIAPAYDPVLLAFGGSTMTFKDHQRCNLEHPDSVRAWQFIQDLMWTDHSTVTPQVNQEQAGYLRWVAGHVAMQQGSHEQTGLVNQQNPGLRYDMAPLPREKAGPATAIQMHIWSVYNRSKNKDLAWHFVNWVSTVGSGTEMGLVPAYKDYALGPDFLQAPQQPAHLKQAQLDPTQWKLTSVPTAYNQKSDEIAGQDGFGPALTSIVTNKKRAADALRSISKKVDAIMRA